MRYYKIEDFAAKSKVGKRTIQRFYKNYPGIGEERKEEEKKKLVPESHFKYFDLGLMIKELEDNSTTIKNLKKIIWLSREENTLACTLWRMDWMIFGTVSYSSDYTKDTCYNKMNKMFNELKKNLDDSELRLFFTTESYDVRGGNHNHFVINCNSQNVNLVNDFIQKHFKWHRVELEEYNPEEAGLFYIMKDGLKGADWDYL